MKKLALLLLTVVALGIAGCGGDDDGEGAEQPAVESGQVPFDRAFIDAMMPHHQAAIEMAEEAKTAGLNDPELVKIADHIIATQQAEIDQMLAWRQQWFGSKSASPKRLRSKCWGYRRPRLGWSTARPTSLPPTTSIRHSPG